VYAIILAGELGGTVVLTDVTLPTGSRARVLGTNTDLVWHQRGDDVELRLPAALVAQAAHVVAIAAG
jgi:hypothetical protein